MVAAGGQIYDRRQAITREPSKSYGANGKSSAGTGRDREGKGHLYDSAIGHPRAAEDEEVGDNPTGWTVNCA